MAIEAPLSRHSKNSLIIMIVALLGFAAWTIYDGFFRESFIKEHTLEDGQPDSTLLFNQKSPPYLFALAGLVGLRWFQIRQRKIIAQESIIVTSNKTQIPYDTIQQIDKTHFDKKGIFIVTYTDADGKLRKHCFDDRKYDNMKAILDHLIERIS
jgi:hypothetical protein